VSNKLVRSGFIVSSMTLISRILGLIRDVVIAHIVGAGAGADVFLLANKIPNFLRRLFAEGAFNQAFVPVLTEYQENKPDEVKLLVAHVSGTLGWVVSGVTLLGVLGSSAVIALFANGWFMAYLQGDPDGHKFVLASFLLKLTFPYLLFIVFVALTGAILNTLGKFAIAAFSPALLNVSMIACAWLLTPYVAQPEVALAWGVFIGGLVQLLFQIPFLWRENMLVRPRWGWFYPGVVKIRQLMLPALLGVSVSQINLLFDTIIASYLVTGSISWLYYSDRLLEFPLGLFGIAIATVILPTLSQRFLRGDGQAFAATLRWGIYSVTALGLPAMVGMFLLAKPMLMVLFMRGAFTEIDVQMASMSLCAYAVGLWSLMVVKILATGFFSRQDTKSPVKYGIIAMCTNIIFNAILAVPFGYVGLAMATSLSALVNMLLLYYGLYQQGIYQFSRVCGLVLFKVLLACLGMVMVINYFNPSFALWLSMPFQERVWRLAILITLGVFTFVIGFWLQQGHKHLLKPIS
jgi:putative peptidoglycan lipid II flippase